MKHIKSKKNQMTSVTLNMLTVTIGTHILKNPITGEIFSD